MHVRHDQVEAFENFQRQINALGVQQPGFCGREVVRPVEGLQEDWIIVFRFDTNDHLQHWLQLPERTRMLEEINPILVHPTTYKVVADEATDRKAATAVFSHRVLPGGDQAFLDWKRRIIEARASFPGFLGSEMFEPVTGVQEEWIDIVRFDSAKHLNAWLKSPQRHKLLDETDQFLLCLEAHPLATGLESWFQLSHKSGSAPAPIPRWKQASIVVMALFPTAVLAHFLVRILPESFNWPTQILLSNIFGVTALTWFIMPRVSKLMGFWTNPAQDQKGWRNNLIGICLVTVFLASVLGLVSWLLTE